MKRSLRRGDCADSQYYDSTSGTKGGVMLAQGAHILFCDAGNVVPADELRQKRGVGGKNPLLVCWRCFGKSIEIPSSGRRTSMKQKKYQPE